MRIINSLLVLLAVVLLVGCSAECDDALQEGLVPIHLTTVITPSLQPVTRTGSDVESSQLPAGEPVHAYFAGGATTVSTVTYTSNGDGTTSLSSGTQPYFTLEGTQTTVHAYHGKSGADKAQVTQASTHFVVQQDQSSEADYLASDLLYASVTLTKSNMAVAGQLQFRHRMAKVVVIVTPSTGVETIREVCIIGGYRGISIADGVTCALGNDFSAPLSESNGLTMFSGSSTSAVTCAALLPPQSISSNFLQVVTDSGTSTYSLLEKTLEGGKTYTIDLTLNAISVSPSTISLSNWAASGSSSTRAGTVIESDLIPAGERFRVCFTGEATTLSETIYESDGLGGASLAAGQEQSYFKFGETSTTMYAWHPATMTGSSGTFSVQSDQSTDTDYLLSDLLYATTGQLTKNDTYIVKPLSFSHLMSKVIVNATASSGVSAITGIYIVGGGKTISLADAEAGTLGSTITGPNYQGEAITMYIGSDASVSCAALIPPQTISGAFIKVTTDVGNLHFTMSDKALESGKTYTLNLTANLAGIGEATGIGDWVNGVATVVPEASAGPKAVDIGLPVLWANMNVGASQDTDFGLYFAWGDTTGHSYGIISGGSVADGYSYTWESYKYYAGTNESGDMLISKYVPVSSSANWGGAGDTPDGKSILDLEDDAAHVMWGDSWVMPTYGQIRDLFNTRNNSSYTWTRYTASPGYKNSGHAGWLIEYNVTGASIFLPAAGYRQRNVINGVNAESDISCSVSYSYAGNYILQLRSSKEASLLNGAYRYYAFQVRGVKNKN